MTEIKPENKSNKFFVTTNLGVDILMSLVFFLSTMSVQLLSLVYIQIVTAGYVTMLTEAFVVVAFVFIRRMRLPFFSMVGVHVVAAGIYLFILDMVWTSFPEKNANLVFIGAFVIFLIIHSMAQRISKQSGRVSFDSFILAMATQVVLFFIFVAMHASKFYTCLTFNAVLTLTIFFIARQFSVFDDKYYHNIHSATQNVSSVKKQNITTIVIVVGGIVFAVLLLLIVPIDVVTSIAVSVIGFFGSILGKILALIWGDVPDETSGELGEIPENTGVAEPSPTPTWLLILSTIVFILILIAVFYILVSFIRTLIKNFSNAKQTDSVENDAVIDIIENVNRKEKRKVSRAMDFGSGQEKEIRKKYYNVVSKAISKGLPISNASSPRQIENVLKKQGDPSISELTSQYESVRYNKTED